MNLLDLIWLIFICTTPALMAGTFQVVLYILTKKKFTMVFIPLICIILSLIDIFKDSDSFLSGIGAYYFGIPAAIGSFLAGIIIVLGKE